MLLIWMAVQLLTLAVAAVGIPLSARFPHPAEREATVELLVVQLAMAALLFPLLLRDWMQLVLAIAGSWPLLALAALLGGEPFLHVASAGVYGAVWLTTLFFWRMALPSELPLRIGVAIAMLWTIGGPVLLYLHAEFGGGSAGWPPASDGALWAMLGGPIWGGLSRLIGGFFFTSADLLLATILVCGIIFSALQGRRIRHLFHNLSTKL